ncbi:MAG: NAD-dependent epimerase/dehydratase family protein [bacterium]|nr:NAD-dependent epimerase/dehydratase family protein [bacterium]
MKSLITGVGGFVGPHLVNQLVSEGDTVFGFDRNKSEIKNCETYSCDITNKADVLDKIIKIKPDKIFHLAGQSSVEKSWDIPDITKKVNVEGTRILLDAVIRAKISPKILIVSSAEVYGSPKKTPIKETQPVNPESPYAESRVEQEKLAMEYYKKGLHIIISRSFNHSGPNQPPVFVCSDFAKQIVEIERNNQEPIMHVGNLDVKRDFTDVRDVVIAYSLALKKAPFGEIYNICSGNAHFIRELLGILISSSKMDIQVKQEEDRIREKDSPILEGDNSKFKAATNWKPKIQVESMLKDILEYWRNN